LTSRFTRILRFLGRALIGICLLGPIWPKGALALEGVTLLPAGPSLARFAIDVGRPQLEKAAGDMSALHVPGFDLDGQPGEPALPMRIVLVAVPPTGSVSVSGVGSGIEWDDARLPAIEWTPRSDEKADPLTPSAPPRMAPSMSPPVASLLDVSWMRDQRVARVRIQPALFDAQARRLGVYRRIEVEVRFEAGAMASVAPQAGARDPFEPVYAGTLINQEQGRAWRRPAATSAARRAAAPAGAQVADVVPDTTLFAHRKWVKIAIPRTGFYRVYFGQLRNSKLFGGDDTVKLDSLRLFVWPGTPVLPEDSYCDSCDYREVAIGIVDDGNGKFDNNNDDYFYFHALGASDWTDLYAAPQDPPQPDTVFLDHPYEARNFYYLTIATAGDPMPGSPRRIRAESGALVDTVGATTPTTFRARAHFEQDNEFHPDATPVIRTNPDGSYNRLPEFWEKWFWTGINNSPSSLFRETVNLPGIEPTLPTRLRLRVWGLNRMTVQNKSDDVSDHYLYYDFGSVHFRGLVGWDRELPLTVDTTVTALTDSGNVLTAQVPPASDVEHDPAFQPLRDDQVGVAWFDVFYPRRFVPVQNELAFDSDPAGGRYVYDIGPFTIEPGSLRLFDVTDPYAPVEILQFETRQIAGGWGVRFNRIESGRHRYRILPDDPGGTHIIKPPNTDVFDAAGSSANLRAGPGADYLLVYYDGFATAAQELAAWRQEHLPLVGVSGPYDVMAIPVSALFDQFSGGRMDPGAIRNFLRAAYVNWTKRPIFVTLLGDASSDFKNITNSAPLGEPGALIPSYEGGYDFVVHRQFATDDWMLNIDNPTRVIPDFYGGRIPAGTEAQALSYVRDKLRYYESSAPYDEWRDRVMLIGDDNMKGTEVDELYWSHMRQTVELDLKAIPKEIDRKYVYLHTYPTVGGSKPQAREDIVAQIESGVVISNFIGHGSPFKLAHENVFLAEDADRLKNRERLTILVAASCDVGKFNSPEGRRGPAASGLGERMVLNPSGGAVAVVSATEEALSTQNARLNLDLLQRIFARDTTTGHFEATLAQGLLAAKTGYANNQKYQVMGDAAVRPNFPRLWVETSVTDENGSPVATVQRGQTMKVSGRLLDRPGGSQVTLDGLTHLLIEDSAPVDTVPDCFDDCFGYPYRASPVFRGDVSLSAGTFSTKFVMPIDAHLGPRGRARAVTTVGSGTTITDAAGMDSMVVAAGTAPSGDVTGPRIQLSFVGGSTRVRPDAVLRVDLFDESGILITGNAPQNGIIVTVDESSTQRYDVTSSFRYAGNSYQSGTALFTLPGLSPGPHRIRVSAADNLAAGITAAEHRASGFIDFEVTASPSLQVTRVILFPNPIRSGGKGGGGQFVIDAPGDSVDVLLKIYTVSGRMIRTLRSQRGLAQAQIPWDGLDAEGDPLAHGTYLFKAQVFTGLGSTSGQNRQTAEEVGRFVVVGK